LYKIKKYNKKPRNKTKPNTIYTTMNGPNHPEYDESFLNEPSKVVELIQFMDVMQNANKMEE